MTRSPTKRFWRWGMGLLILVLGAAALAPTPQAGAQQPDGSCGTVTLKLDQNDVEFSFHAYFEEGENCSGGYVEAWAGPGDPEQPLEMEVRFDLDAGTMTGAISGECHWAHQKEGVSDSLDAEFFGQISGRVEPGVPEGLVDTFWVFDGWLDLTMEIRATDMCRECTQGDDGSDICETFSDSYRGSFQVRAPITGNASPLAEFTAFFEDPYASGSSPGPATLDLWVLTEHWEAILGGENNSPILKKAFPSWPEIPCGKWGSGSSDNTPPEVKALDFEPLDPTSSDRIVFTAKATDPDGDELSYQWAIDGQVREKATKANLRWRSPPPGEHLVSVTVSDGRGGSDTAEVWVFVKEGDARPDHDEDGVCDDDDLCPDEFGLNADGCPDLAVQLGCQPIAPTLEDSVDCTAALGGARQGETFEFHWYRNSIYVATTEVPSWSFGPLETGFQYIAVQAVGEGRSADAELTLEVGEPQPLKVSLSHFPDPALEGSSVVFAATVSGGRDGQRPAFSWRLDGSDVGGDNDSWTWTEAQLGQHAVSVFVEQGEEMASASVEFLVLDAIVIPNNASITEAGFDVALDCYRQLYSDETLECTARLDRLQDRVVLLDVWWIVDGATAKMGSTVGTRDSWSLGTPPPGTHDITVVVSDPLTGLSRSDSAGVVVQEAAGVVPPTVTAGAAGGTTLIFISWLWGEHILNKRAAEAAARRKPPSWVFDDRSLGQIEEAEALEEAARRGLWDHEYKDGRFLAPDYIAARQQEEQKGKFWRLRNNFADLAEKNPHEPMWGDLTDFIDRNFDNVFHDGMWDEQQLDRLSKAVDRIGRRELGIRQAKDYTYTDAIWDTLGEFSENTFVRIASGFVSLGRSEAVLQPLSTICRMRKKALEGHMDADKAAQEAYRETAVYAASAILSGVAASGFQRAAGELLRDMAPLATRIGGAIARRAPRLTAAVTGLARATANLARRIWRTLNTPIDRRSVRGLLNRWRGQTAPTGSPIRQPTGAGRPGRGIELLDRSRTPTRIIRRPDGLPAGSELRARYVRRLLRQAGVREDLVRRMGYEASPPRRAATSFGRAGRRVRSPSYRTEGYVLPEAFEAGPVQVEATAFHELDHLQQHGQLATQAAPGGPRASFFNRTGGLTDRGRCILEMEAYAREYDHLLAMRNRVIREGGGVLGNRGSWPDQATRIQEVMNRVDKNFRAYGRRLDSIQEVEEFLRTI